MFQCPYCTTLFPTLPSEGGCPRCGAPKPTQLEPEVKKVLETHYVYIPNSEFQERSYYTPRFTSMPMSAVRSTFFGTFGYKLSIVILILVLLLLASSFIYWLNYRVPALRITDASYQQILPTALPTATSVTHNNPWMNESWLTAAEAKELRSQTNVVNLAYLDKGGASYSTQHSVTLTEPWKQVKPLNVTECTVTETSVSLKAGGYLYTLNIYQPFVLAGQPDKVHLVDNQGQIWQADLSAIQLLTLEEVRDSLPVTLPINPNLTFSY